MDKLMEAIRDRGYGFAARLGDRRADPMSMRD